MSTGDDFRQVLLRAGLHPPAVIPPGEMIRFPGVSKSNGNKSGWAKFFADGQGGVYGDWASDLSENWHAARSTPRTPAEREAHTRRIAEMKRIRHEEETTRHAEAAQRALSIWDAAKAADPIHPYLKKKRVQAHGLRVDSQNRLIVPVLIDETIASLEFIDTDGDKKFLPGGRVRGGFCPLGDADKTDTILLCEGFATGATLQQATGFLVIMAFHAGNLLSVAQQLRQQFPTATILVCGDNDVRDDGTPNTGLLAATAAAEVIGGLVAIPEAINNRKTDWNDVAVQRGPDAVRAAIEAVLTREDAATMGTATILSSYGARTRCTDVGNGELFARQHRETVRYCYGLKRWFVWDGQRWKPDDGGGMTLLAKQTALSLYALAAQEPDDHRRKALAKWAAESETERRLKSMVNLAQSEPGIAIDVDQLDTDLLLLNVANGTLDLRTAELRTARREDFITKLVPVDYRPDATCPALNHMLDRIFGAVRAIRQYLQRIFGYALTGLTSEQCFFLFHGQGSNGKSTLLNTVLALLGEYADASRPETFLVKHGDGGIPNDVAALAGRRFVVSLESEKGKRLAEGLVKGMTGSDTLKARFLNKEFFAFTPQFKLFIGTNHKPTILGTDDGIWRRVRCVPFAVQIPDAEKDRQLPAKLEAERSGILNWLIQGCLAWQRDGLGEPLEILAASAAYRAEQDVLGVFLKERCVLERAAEVFKKDLFATYLTWCEESGEHYRLTMREFGKVLRERGLTETRTATAKGWLGIRIRTPLDIYPDDDDGLVATQGTPNQDAFTFEEDPHVD